MGRTNNATKPIDKNNNKQPSERGIIDRSYKYINDEDYKDENNEKENDNDN